jgi:hypothetical protein
MANSPNAKKSAAITNAPGASPRLGIVVCITRNLLPTV